MLIIICINSLFHLGSFICVTEAFTTHCLFTCSSTFQCPPTVWQCHCTSSGQQTVHRNNVCSSQTKALKSQYINLLLSLYLLRQQRNLLTETARPPDLNSLISKSTLRRVPCHITADFMGKRNFYVLSHKDVSFVFQQSIVSRYRDKLKIAQKEIYSKDMYRLKLQMESTHSQKQDRNIIQKWSRRAPQGDNNEQKVGSHCFRPEILCWGQYHCFVVYLKMYGSAVGVTLTGACSLCLNTG